MDFKAKYDRNNFIEFFSNNLLPEDFETATEIIELDFNSRYYQSVTYLGQSKSLDLNVYEIRHTSERDARVGLSRDAFKLVSRFGANNALIFFVPENPDNFRLSLVTIQPKLDDKGIKILKVYSNPRRYSFVLGDDARTHTPEQYLIAFGRITDNADLNRRFSVEVVNKQFYGQIAEMFSKLVGGQRKQGSRMVEFQRQLVMPSVDSTNDQKYKEFAVRLIGRTVFCWFLKKKKSNAGVPLIHNDVLSRFAADFTPDFYHARVEPLFFEILNTAIDKRKPNYKEGLFDKIPFLNGGLFEPHTDDYYKLNTVTGKSEYSNTLKIPDQWWKELLSILEIYNFTIDENTSIDIDLSVDPEMLGRIFENLLAEINPETGDTARKSTGSYYTPRPIVEYMVDQSLKQYLLSKANIAETQIDLLLDYSTEDSGLDADEEKQVIDALNTIKILDPACGSGAFPMGMLQKMLLILQKVDHGAQNSVQQILNEITDPMKRELIRRKLETAQVLNDIDFDDYARKLNVIQRSIYGVDIQPIATEISKLRFFLSLVVDEVIQDEAPNRGIEPLPNLEFKFVCANTIIPLPEADSFEKMFGDTEFVAGLENIRTRFFTASNDDKPALKKEFEGLQNKLYNYIAKNKDILSNPYGRLALLAAWKPFSDDAARWFDPKWMFGVNDGFDVVIGNPPYLESRNKSFNEEMKISYQNAVKHRYGKDSLFITKGSDLMIYFFEASIKFLNESGINTFITQNSWLDTEYGRGFQKFLLKNSNVLSIIDSDFKYFDSKEGPNINTVITFIRNKAVSDKIDFARFHTAFKGAINLNDYNSDEVTIKSFLKSDNLLSNQKWGTLLYAPEGFLDILNILGIKAVYFSKLKGIKLTIGQGLNLSSEYYVDKSFIDLNSLFDAAIPIMSKEEGAPFKVISTYYYLLDEVKLKKEQIKTITLAGYKCFNSSGTKKIPPILILPRGIGRHFCAINEINCFSSSCVDIYITLESTNKNIIFNLWLFFNSSLFWLIREISGRKNLGGGMLKAEAIDLEYFPLYMDFNQTSKIKSIYNKISKREALQTINEIDSVEHKEIDEMVFNYLNLKKSEQNFIVSLLKEMLQNRSNKSKT